MFNFVVIMLYLILFHVFLPPKIYTAQGYPEDGVRADGHEVGGGIPECRAGSGHGGGARQKTSSERTE